MEKLNSWRIVLVTLCGLALAGFGLAAAGADYPAYTSVYTNDFAGILDDASEERINARLQTLKESQDREFTVVTIARMSDYGHNGALEPFATGLFNHWGVGNPERDDGIMLLVAVKDRVLRIELGSGYPTAMDKTAQRIIDRNIVPAFKQGNLQQGVEEGVERIISGISLNPPNHASAADESPGWYWLLYLLGGGGAAVGGHQAVSRYRRNKPRKCPHCNSTMQRLCELDEDAYLSEGQETEEYLESRDHDVWQCPRDATVIVQSYKRWFSKHQHCKHCKFRTLEKTSQILEQATTSRQGKKRLSYRCLHCNKQWEVIVAIPRVSQSSSSNSSFSGGSSSGGGASGSW